jgi:hypothetical protein
MKFGFFNLRHPSGWLALVMLCLGAGCATHRIDWQSRIGNYTYDQALTELGPPDKSAKLTDGSVVADWLTQHSQVFLAPGATTFYPYGPGGIGMVGSQATAINTPDYYLRLTFDPAGKLKTWKNFAR